VSKQRRKHVAQQITSATSTATTPTTMQVATGTRVTAVVSKTTTNFAKIASAVTAHTSRRVISALNLSKKVAGLQIGRVTATAMTTTTTQGVIGMGVIAAAPKILLTAKIASAGTARMYLRATSASKISRKHAALRNSKATATATTTTILVVVLGTVVTAAEPRPTSNIAKSANARIAPRKKPRAVLVRRRAAPCPSTRATKIVTTRTTIADAVGTEVTVVANPSVARSIRSIARLANAWTLIIKVTPIAKGFVSSRTTKAMATATTKTTTAVAITTAAIVARNH